MVPIPHHLGGTLSLLPISPGMGGQSPFPIVWGHSTQCVHWSQACGDMGDMGACRTWGHGGHRGLGGNKGHGGTWGALGTWGHVEDMGTQGTPWTSGHGRGTQRTWGTPGEHGGDTGEAGDAEVGGTWEPQGPTEVIGGR